MLRSETVRTDGAVLLKGLLEPERLRNIRRAYRPVLTARIDRAGPDRGPERYYATPRSSSSPTSSASCGGWWGRSR